jgi:SAM-dependent methyltransferase
MALDSNTIKFLFWAKSLGLSLERTMTLGRQNFSCSPHQLRRMLRNFGVPGTEEQISRCFQHPPFTRLYADEFLRFLGADEPVSVDYSDFEGATLLHDLNQPFPENLRKSFDLVLDVGTLEHIFNYPAALSHCLELVKVGGHFVTITPANNFMGHGFYQFSPELFFRVFSPENGFTLRKIVLHELFRADADFYEVKDPAVTGLRTELASAKPMELAVLAQRTSEVPLLTHPPQQSDYAASWQRRKGKTNKPEAPPSGLTWRVRLAVNRYWPEWLKRWKNRLLYRREHGRPTLRNHRYFRRLSREEIFRARP